MKLNRKFVPLVILGLLQAGDLLSTRMVMKIPGALEANPLVRDLGLWQAKLLALAVVILLVWRSQTLGRLWAACGVYAAVVLSNTLMFVNHTKVLAQRMGG